MTFMDEYSNPNKEPASEEIEFFNTDDEQYSKDDIKMDDIISERKQHLKEGYDLYINLINTKPVFNESKDIDKITVVPYLYNEGFNDGQTVIQMVLPVNEEVYNTVMNYMEDGSQDLTNKLISKLNKRKESANNLVSQYVDAILCENFVNPINSRVYSLYRGRTIDYNEESMTDKISKMKENPETLNESLDFYFNGFNKKSWL